MPDDKFPKTSWTNIRRAGTDTPEGLQMLALLCKAYWYPVYAFIRHRIGSVDTAHDRTQGFFTRLIDKKHELLKVDRTLGYKFRSWLLACVKNYLANCHKHYKTTINVVIDSLDAVAVENRYLAEPSHDLTPERLYDRNFAKDLLDGVIKKLRAKYAAAGKELRFEALKGGISGDATLLPYEELAVKLHLSVDAVKKAVFDMRAAYKQLLRAEVASVVEPSDDDPNKVDDELRYLSAALAD